MMNSLSIINLDSAIFKLMQIRQFDVHQIEYCREFFIG